MLMQCNVGSMRMARLVLLLSVFTDPAAVLGESLRAQRGPAGGLLLNATVLRRAAAEKTVATAADEESRGDAEAALASQSQLLAGAAEAAATDSVEASRPVVPEAKAATTEARKAARDAAVAASAVKDGEATMRAVASDAAKAAAASITAMIRQDAVKAAEEADKKAQEWKATKSQRVAAAVAASMEPYHLALLRAQKEEQKTYAQAKSAMSVAQQLETDGKKQAADAQAMQSAGMGVQAQQMMMMAHGTMDGAANMKAWAEKLYNTANQLGSSLGHYQLSQSMAAANTAATLLYNEPPELPEE